MSLISVFRSAWTALLTRGAGADKVTASEVRSVMDLTTNELVDRGVKQLPDTGALANTPNSESKMVYVESTGFFRDKSIGVPNGTTIFAGVGGRYWVKVDTGSSVGSNQPVSLILNGNGSFVIPAGYGLEKTLITPSGNSAIRMNTDDYVLLSDDDDDTQGKNIGAGFPYLLRADVIAKVSSITITITGITSQTEFLFFLYPVTAS